MNCVRSNLVGIIEKRQLPAKKPKKKWKSDCSAHDVCGDGEYTYTVYCNCLKRKKIIMLLLLILNRHRFGGVGLLLTITKTPHFSKFFFFSPFFSKHIVAVCAVQFWMFLPNDARTPLFVDDYEEFENNFVQLSNHRM